MSRFKLSPDADEVSAELERWSVADRFAEIMNDISLDYDLDPDVLSVAQDVLQELKAREKHWN
jgi:hypothetical protein